MRLSLSIDIDKVSQVLLSDRWHRVKGNSFTLDAYEMLWWSTGKEGDGDPDWVHIGGGAGICATGFCFMEEGQEGKISKIFGPLTSILAVKYGPK